MLHGGPLHVDKIVFVQVLVLHYIFRYVLILITILQILKIRIFSQLISMLQSKRGEIPFDDFLLYFSFFCDHLSERPPQYEISHFNAVFITGNLRAFTKL